MSTSSTAIPHEKQFNPQTNRGCGAACLSMVYRSFGKEVPHAETWPMIAKPNRFGIVSSTTHLMAQHAIGQGLSAVILQARHPIQVLRLCREGGIAAILNLRAGFDSCSGHFTALVDIDDKMVVLYDPAVGPARRMSHAELLELWRPNPSNSEILGNVVIGIAAEPAAIPACEFCHTKIPSSVACPKCKNVVGLSPETLLGCIRDGCIARMWNYVACPACDFVWSFNEAGSSTADQPRPAQADPRAPFPGPPNLDQVFAELDKFCAHILTLPGAAEHADVHAQLNFIRAGKEKLKLAQAEELGALKARVEGLAAFAERSKKNVEADRKREEELNAPPPPLDGNVLSAALLKNLGFK
jgi:hypothetical protein